VGGARYCFLLGAKSPWHRLLTTTLTYENTEWTIQLNLLASLIDGSAACHEIWLLAGFTVAYC
jgi:hypothetical protein